MVLETIHVVDNFFLMLFQMTYFQAVHFLT